MDYIVALDQGTTSSRTIVFDRRMRIVSMAQREFRQLYPRNGWVEHDPFDILATQTETLREAVARAGIEPGQVAAIGIANQRETTLVWERATGRPICNAIVWQCRRTAPMCSQLAQQGAAPLIRERTGLVLDAYFSATKIRWILDNIPGARKKAEAGELVFGTVDTWLIWNLTREKLHATDITNAARTMLFNIHTHGWDDELLQLFAIPESMLPNVRANTNSFGTLHRDILGAEIPICASVGDQQGALFGQACFERGDAKNTYGTGCFVLMNTGDTPVASSGGLLSTVAWDVGAGVQYALEGSIFMGGATIQWLRDELHMIRTSDESQDIARSVPDNGGVYLVPAFAGLGAPVWDMYARGTLVGMTRGTNRGHIVRAALESIAYQTYDVLQTMQKDSGMQMPCLKADGGASANDLLMQFQSDILRTGVVRPACVQTTAMGAAYMAGIASGLYRGAEEVADIWRMDREFTPAMPEQAAQAQLHQWRRAVDRSLAWAQP